MPLYDIQCDEGHRFERMIPLAQFEEPIECPCGASARRLISRPMFNVDNTDYTCPVTGDWIGSKHAHRENLRKQGCRVLETGETEAATARRKADDAAFDKAIEDTVEKEVLAMDSTSREKLYSELTRQNLDVSYDRTTA